MPSHGSSRLFRTTIQRIVGYTGPVGPTGPTGAQGPRGDTGFGPAGEAGDSVIDLRYLNKRIINVFDDGTEITTTTNVIGPNGNYMLGLSGASLSSYANFLRHTERASFTELGGNSAIRDITYFRNIKSSTPDQVQISYDSSNNIKISYNLQDVADLFVASGNTPELAINLPGNIQRGLTGSRYNVNSTTVKALLSDVGQRLKIVNATSISSYQSWTCDINNDGNIFYISQLNNLSSTITTNKLILKTPENPNFAHSISVIVSPNTSNQFPTLYEYTNDEVIDARKLYSPVVWPLGDPPCFSGNYDLLHFISIGGVWYGYVASYDRTGSPSGFSTPGRTYSNELDSELFSCNNSSSGALLAQRSGFAYLFSGATYGICCNSTCGFTLTDTIGCTGYFIPGITYNSGLTLCSVQGACCLKTQEQFLLDCQELTYCECATIANQSNLLFNWTKFEGLKKSCDDVNCTNSLNGIGACCDGSGSCVETTNYNCNGVWQGFGVKCTTSENKNVCYDGYGACCDSGITCQNGITGSSCFSENKSYFGDMSKCDYLDCSASQIPCLSVVPNQNLNIGDIYENGIVVGIFNPENSSCYGSSLFSLTTTNFAGVSYSTNAKEYSTVYDYSGYGFTLEERCSTSYDSYIMLMSLYPITIDENNQIVNYTGEGNQTYNFSWSNGSNSWGPMFDVQTLEIDPLSFNTLKEGYVYDYNIPETKNNLKFSTFARCNAIRQTDDVDTWVHSNPNSSFNGKWYRNWGFMNTARMINSEFYHYAGISYDGITSSDYIPETTDMTISRLVSLYNLKYPQTNEMVSDWFLPSHDELAFIANSCSNIDDNINVKLLLKGGTPLNGWYWSSTGSYGKSNEMVLNHPDGLKIGSAAWAVKFDINADASFMVAKKQRSDKYQVRLIRMIRCDGKYYNLSNENNKYWKLLTLDERTIT
jgi:hypothetical protein